MATTLLCCGDIHLGRRPTRLPEALAEHDLHPRSLTPASAWRRVVEVGIERRPAAVVLAGDVVDSEAARFEAFGHLKQGVERLTEAGVDVIAIAGNHDVDALPRLAAMMPGFRLLGAGGRWEALELGDDPSAPELELWGWSFPDRHGDPDPLASLPRRPVPPGRTRLGLLHTELDGTEPRYAPVRQGDLAAAPVSGWLLGHLHAPSLDPSAPRPLGYLGSLVGLDPTETGPRGAWELRARPEGGIALARVAISPLRWEAFELDVSPIDDPRAELFPALERAVARHHEKIAPGLGEARAVGCRVALTGRTRRGGDVRQAAAELDERQPVLPCGDVLYFFDRLRVEVAPAWDLEQLAAGTDPLALLAQELLALERGQPDPTLVDAAREEIRHAAAPTRDPALGLPTEPSDDEVIACLKQAGRRALDELLAQRGEGP